MASGGTPRWYGGPRGAAAANRTGNDAAEPPSPPTPILGFLHWGEKEGEESPPHPHCCLLGDPPIVGVLHCAEEEGETPPHFRRLPPLGGGDSLLDPPTSGVPHPLRRRPPPPPLLLTVGPPQHPHPDTSVVGPNDDDGGVGVSSPPTGWARSSWKWVDPMAPSAAPPQRSEGAINAGPNEAMEGRWGGVSEPPPPPCPIGAAVPHRSCCATPTAAGAAAFSCCGRGASPARCWRCVGRT